MIPFIVFTFGLTIGSFLNAFIYRLEVQEGLRPIPNNRKKSDITILRGRSLCPLCSHTLAWYDLIPLVSFLLLQGRCRYCKGKISFQYPLVELATALIFVLLVNTLAELNFSYVLELLYLWTIATLLIAIVVYDLKHFLIPDKILFLAIGITVLWRGFEFFSSGLFVPLLASLLAGLGASLFFFIIYTVSRGRAMGFGDVKLAFFLGLFLGWPSILVVLFAAFCLGAFIGLILIALKKKGLKSEVPFAPFLIIGTAIAYFFGSSILSWYLGLILV